jgi:hypothetical protein
MEYLPLIVILGIVSACAIAAYELLDAIERDEYEGSPGWSGRARVAVLDAATSSFSRASSPRSSEQPGDAIPVERGAVSVQPASDRLDIRIRGLETRLERLERECDRIES